MNDIIVVLVLVFSISGLILLALRSGERYSHHDADSHATVYAGKEKEGHGPLTVFLMVSFLAIFLFSVVYVSRHAGEFLADSKTSGQMGTEK